LIEDIVITEAHRSLQFINLQHSHARFTGNPLDEAEPVERCQGTDWSVQRLPAACPIAAVIDNQEGHFASKRLDRAPSPGDSWLC
jgi:hypothetical protein